MSVIPQQIHERLDELCALLDAELERQHGVLASLHAQGQAARGSRTEALDERTAGLALLMGESVRSEQERLRILRSLVQHFGLEGKDQTLSNLIDVVPEPWKHRLAEFQTDLREVVSRSRTQVQHNARTIRGRIKRLDTSLSMLHGEDPAKGAQYSAEGATLRRGSSAPYLDALG